MLLLVEFAFVYIWPSITTLMKYHALSQMCGNFATLVPMHAGLLQRSAQESTIQMASLLVYKNTCIFVFKKGSIVSPAY